ncbi:MAG: ABC transporter ATP-binding protein [Eubacteriales bacterium]|nr:ABC transporter ATP-binding protein [Eubacteriales bacterium]
MLLKCSNLSFAYGGRTVLEDVNFSLESTDYLAILGENGSGKSTLIKGLLGLKTPEAGQIDYAAGLSAKEIGYLPQQSEIQRDFPATVREIVLSGRLNSLGWRPFYGREDRRKLKEILALLKIEELEKKSFRELSGGQQQRVLLARALLASKRLLLLDEPLAGLDPLVAADFYRILEEVNASGIAVILVTHDVAAIEHRAKKILHLANKQLYFGLAEEYFESALGRAFLGLGEEDGHVTNF